MSIKAKSISGLLWDAAGSLSNQGIGFFISIFLARLLMPEEFGIVGMALVFISIFQVFADFGFTAALIQNKENSNIIYSSVFYFNIIAGVFLFFIFFLVAPIIGNFYSETAITDLVQWLALGFIFTSFSLVQRAILTRNLEFKKLATQAIASQFSGGVIGTTMAYWGYGVYALIGQNLTASIISTIFLWKISNWYPRWEFSWSEIKKLTVYSSFVFYDSLTSTIFSRLDVLVIGKIFSPATLGFFSRAESLNNLVAKSSSRPIIKVFFPVLSKYQDNPDNFIRIYFKIISILSFVVFFSQVSSISLENKSSLFCLGRNGCLLFLFFRY